MIWNNFKSLSDILENTAAHKGDKIAFIEINEDGKTRSINFKELLECVRKLGFELRNLNITKGDRIILLSENNLEWIIYFFAINYIGAVCIPLDPKLNLEEIKKISLNSEAKLCFLSNDRLVNLKVSENNFYRLMNDINNIKKIDFELFEWIYNDLACLIYTSGTTGEPKAVMLSNENYIANLKSIFDLNLANENDVFLCLLPLYHSFPLMVNLFLPVLYGLSSVILKTLRSDIIRSVIKNYKITIIPAVPIFYKNLMDAIIRKLKDNRLNYYLFSKLSKICVYIRKHYGLNAGKIIFRKLHKELAPYVRFFISGGARLDPDVFSFFYGAGFNILEGYGLTEASPVVCFNPLNKEKEGSVGKPLPGISIKIDSSSSTDIGEILVRGNNVMLGYWKNSKLTEETLVDGWLRTGDLGYIDSEGYLFITGRKKEIIVLSTGKNIYPDDIEEFFLKKIREIEECVAIPVTDKGEVNLGIVIKAKDEKKEDIRKQVSQLSKLLPDYKRPRKIFFTNIEIPKTNLGKPKRNVLKKLYQTELEIPVSEEIIYDDPLVLKVIDSIRKITESRRITLDNDLELDLGLDSLKKVELSLELENALSIKLPDGFMADIATVNELIEHLRKFDLATVTAQKKDFNELIIELPEEYDIKQIQIRDNIFFRFFEFVFFILVKITANILYSIEIQGFDKIKALKEPFILAPNHLSYLDGYILSAALDYKTKKKLFFIGLADFFDKTLMKVFKKPAGILSFDEIKEPIRAIKTSIYVLKKGYSICIFPEGARSYDGKLMDLKKGIAYIAKNVDVPLFPVYIHGTFEAWPRFKKYPRFFKRIKVIIGDPIFWEHKKYNEDDFVKQLKNKLILLSKAVEKK